MRHEEIKVGGKYRAKVNNRITTVQVDHIRFIDAPCTPSRHWKQVPRYDITNLSTGVKLTLRSAQKFLGLVELLRKD